MNHKSIDFTLDVSNKSSVIQNLADNIIDFALVSVLPMHLEVEEERLMPNDLYLVGDSPEFDSERPLIFREEGSATRLAMDQYFGNVERKRLMLTSNEAVKQAVLAGIGYSILPLIGIKNELKSGSLHLIKRPDLPITTTWRLIWLKNKKRSPVAEAYLNYVRTHKKSIIDTYFAS